jgi:hypothetical protein
MRGRAELCGGALHGALIEIREIYGGPLGDKGLGDPEPDAASGAGHEGDLVL